MFVLTEFEEQGGDSTGWGRGRRRRRRPRPAAPPRAPPGRAPPAPPCPCPRPRTWMPAGQAEPVRRERVQLSLDRHRRIATSRTGTVQWEKLVLSEASLCATSETDSENYLENECRI